MLSGSTDPVACARARSLRYLIRAASSWLKRSTGWKTDVGGREAIKAVKGGCGGRSLDFDDASGGGSIPFGTVLPGTLPSTVSSDHESPREVGPSRNPQEALVSRRSAHHQIPPAGLEPATFSFGGLRSIQLSFEKDSPANGTSATMSTGISNADWRLVRLVPRFPTPNQLLLISCFRNGCPPPWRGIFMPSARSLSEAGRLSGFVGTSRPVPLRGCGCRSRAARRTRLERRSGRHGPARARSSRWAGPGPARRVVAPAARRVPEPGTFAMLVAGLFCGGCAFSRRRSARRHWKGGLAASALR